MLTVPAQARSAQPEPCAVPPAMPPAAGTAGAASPSQVIFDGTPARAAGVAWSTTSPSSSHPRFPSLPTVSSDLSPSRGTISQSPDAAAQQCRALTHRAHLIPFPPEVKLLTNVKCQHIRGWFHGFAVKGLTIQTGFSFQNILLLKSPRWQELNIRIWLLISTPEIGHCISQMCVVTTSLRRRKLSGVEPSRAERLEDETGLRRSLTCSSLLLKEVRIQPPHTGIHSIHIISYPSSTFFLLFGLRVRTASRFMLCSQRPQHKLPLLYMQLRRAAPGEWMGSAP